MTAVDLPDRLWGRLATAAENRGITVGQLLVEGIEQALDAGHMAELQAELRAARRDGFRTFEASRNRSRR